MKPTVSQRITKPCITIALLLLATIARSQPATLLEEAYNKKSTKLLKQFFREWNQQLPTVTATELSKLNDTIQQTYKAFTAFYKPQRIDSIGGSEWGNDIYKHVDFFVVQNSIQIYFTDKLFFTEQEIHDSVVANIKASVKKDSTQQKLLGFTAHQMPKDFIDLFGPNSSSGRVDKLADSIDNFRPPINCNGKPPLYLDKTYKDMLNSFLGNTHVPLGAGSIMSPARSAGESEKRKKFLERCIKIWYGHWGGYWQLCSYPTANRITFDKDMQYAEIAFRMVYQGGVATLKNSIGKWTLISAQLTWIE